MKKLLDAMLVAAMLATCVPAVAEDVPQAPQGTPPAMTQPGEKPDGEPGEPPDGQPGAAMGTPPDGQPGGQMGGGPGGMGGGSQPDSYDAVYTFDSGDNTLDVDTVSSSGTDENALLVTGGTLTVAGTDITRMSEDSTGGDSASFYGVGAAVLVTGGNVTVTESTISTDSKGGAGVFAYGDGVAYVSDTHITTKQDTSGGIHVAGGGTLYAQNLTVETYGGSSAAIRSDRGSGTMVVDGGTYVSHGSGSPAVYVTADISIQDAELTATGSEALCLEGLNTVRLYNCQLSGAMADDAQNDNTWTVILYQSMSGDSQMGEGSFLMDGGTLISENGGIFYTTNTQSRFILRNVAIVAADDCEYVLRVTGNANQRGWGQSGQNGADCVFTAIQQQLNGNVVYDSISNLTLYLTEGSTLTGAVVDDESCAGNGGSGTASLVIDAASAWVVTADSTLTSLDCAGQVVDSEGRTVTILGTDGTVYVQGESTVTVTVASYATDGDASAADAVDTFAEHGLNG